MAISYPNTRAFSHIALKRDTGDAFAALPVHVLITHVLKSGNLPDGSDLARLRAVSLEMRDAVAATGRRVYELRARNAIQFGDLSGLQLLHQRGVLTKRSDQELDSLNTNTACLCTFTAQEGQLEILKWLRANDFPWSERTCEYAAESGHLEVLQWARENGCPWHESTCKYAATGGRLEVLQWARANGCPWNERTCGAAAVHGHLEVLQWARANGCPWDGRTCDNAKKDGHLDMLQWAIANGCPWVDQFET